jgi:hypothetical protein
MNQVEGKIQKKSFLRTRRRYRVEFLKARERLFMILVNSTALFMLSYLCVYLLNQSITMGVAKMVGISSTLRYFEIFYHIGNTSPQWTFGRILFVSITAPGILLLIGNLVLFVLLIELRLPNYWKMFFFWVGFHCVNFFFGGLIAAAATGRGIGYPLDYFFWPHIWVYLLIGVFCAGFLVLFGYKNSAEFLRITPSRFWIKRHYRKQYFLYSLFLPWLIGSAIFFMLKFPNVVPQHESIFLHDTIMTGALFFMILPMFFYRQPIHLNTERLKSAKRRYPFLLLPLLVVIILVIYRVLLSN